MYMHVLELVYSVRVHKTMVLCWRCGLAQKRLLTCLLVFLVEAIVWIPRSVVCKLHELKDYVTADADVFLMSHRDPWHSLCSRKMEDMWCRNPKTEAYVAIPPFTLRLAMCGVRRHDYIRLALFHS
jgi:hypothetical protein